MKEKERKTCLQPHCYENGRTSNHYSKAAENVFVDMEFRGDRDALSYPGVQGLEDPVPVTGLKRLCRDDIAGQRARLVGNLLAEEVGHLSEAADSILCVA